MNIMLDLETLSTANNALILSIGAVKFDPHGEGLDEKFHVAIDPHSAQAAGLHISASTVLWWMEPDRADARHELLKHTQVDLATALDGFATWMGAPLPVWGNGAAFDNVILRSAYEAIGLTCPWDFWDDRCYRTLKNLNLKVKLERSGTHHNALDDACTQAEHLQRMLRGPDA